MVSAETADSSHHNDSDNDSGQDAEVPGFIILPHADLNEIKGIPYDRISLLGACNPDFPLYINGAEVQTTVNGYFSMYGTLIVGDNPFLFENGGAVDELVVTRKIPEYTQPKPPNYFTEPTYGIAANTIISRFYERDDDDNPGTPLIEGTVFQLIAEDDAKDGFYQLYDGSYVFKSSVEILEEAGENTLYSVDLQEKTAILTLYHFDAGENQAQENDNQDTQNNDISEQHFKLTTETFEFPFKEGRTVTGYSVEIEEGKPTVRVQYALTDLSKATVLLDAGHGGKDPGALGPPGAFGLMEKDFNLIVAQKARDYLENRDVNVIFLRDSDEHIPILERMENLAGSFDIGVSVHSNSMPMNKDFWSDEGPLMFYSMEHAEQAASELLEYITAQTGHAFSPAILRNFGITRYTAAPAMLLEMGYVCNPAEYERLITPDYLDLLGESLGEGIMRYLMDTVQEEFDGEDENENDETIEEETVAPAPATQTPPERNPEIKSYTEPEIKHDKTSGVTGIEAAFLGLVALGSIIRIGYELKK